MSEGTCQGVGGGGNGEEQGRGGERGREAKSEAQDQRRSTTAHFMRGSRKEARRSQELAPKPRRSLQGPIRGDDPCPNSRALKSQTPDLCLSTSSFPRLTLVHCTHIPRSGIYPLSTSAVIFDFSCDRVMGRQWLGLRIESSRTSPDALPSCYDELRPEAAWDSPLPVHVLTRSVQKRLVDGR